MDELYLETVLDLVETVPAGKVVTYGDIAVAVGAVLHRGGPRIVGRIMALHGGAVPWWRVVNAAGSPPAHHLHEALDHLRAEGCPLTAGGDRVALARARWSPPVPKIDERETNDSWPSSTSDTEP